MTEPAAVDPAHAYGLPDGFGGWLTHCGQPMAWTGNSVRWTGQPGRGAEHATAGARCRSCTATAEISAQEPC